MATASRDKGQRREAEITSEMIEVGRAVWENPVGLSVMG